MGFLFWMGLFRTEVDQQERRSMQKLLKSDKELNLKLNSQLHSGKQVN